MRRAGGRAGGGQFDRTRRRLVIRHDSMYARHIALKEKKAHANVALARRCWAELERARASGRTVSFVHVQAHVGHKWNELADQLAERGGAGETCRTGRYAGFGGDGDGGLVVGGPKPQATLPPQSAQPSIASLFKPLAHGVTRRRSPDKEEGAPPASRRRTSAGGDGASTEPPSCVDGNA